MFPAGRADIAVRHVTLPSGVRVRVAERGPADGPPVLLVHGWGASMFTFRHNFAPLAEAGHRVLAFDQKGHGGSDKPKGAAEYSLDAMTRHLLEVIAALGLQRVALVGHSMGGAVALRATFQASALVTRLVAVSPIGFGTVTGIRLGRACPAALVPLVRRCTTRRSVAELLRLLRGDLARVDDEVVDQYWLPTRMAGYHEAMWSLVRQFEWNPLDLSCLEELHVPLLVIAGTRDRLVRMSDAHRLACESGGAELLLVKGAGHLPQEDAPDVVNAALLRFLAEPAQIPR